MTIRQSIHAAIEHLKSHRIVFEPGLTDDEIARVENLHGFRFPPDFRQFLQTALPVTGGFPNWRSESENDLRYRYLDRPTRGVLFDVEHNDFWADEWGPRPDGISDAVAKAEKCLAAAPRLIPLRSYHFLPALPWAEGNPVFSVRQTDITCISCDLPSYLMGRFDAEGQTKNTDDCRVIPFWTEVARTSRLRVPNLAGPAVSDSQAEYAWLCRVVKRAGFWAEVIPLGKGEGVAFDRQESTSERRYGDFWIARRDFGWLLCVRCPRFYFAPDAERISELCLTLLNELPHEELDAGRLPFWNFRLDDEIRREFGLVAIHHFTDFNDQREAKLRAWERLGWREMSHGQMDEAWKEYEERTGQRKQGGFTTPAPSVTWDISPIYLRGKDYLERLESDLTLKALQALMQCTRPGEELLALDWQHPCYFFDPHAGVSDARPSSWAVPVLPNGDHYLFLAQDYRFGIIGNCVDMTVCVFGQELLDAFAVAPPLIFNKPTWTVEQRVEKELQWNEQGWQRLTVDEKEDIWERFDSKFGFYQRRANPDAPAIQEPTPSLTWAIALPCHEAEADDLTLKILAGLKKATKPGERLYALDSLRWYEHYTFDPHRLESASRDSWALPVYPDDNYVIFLAADFRFGVFGNPLEKTFCIFGKKLLEAMGRDRPFVVSRMVRKDGKAVAT
jgi:Protein of unknown function (DUF2716)